MNPDFRTFAPANPPAAISTAITFASALRKIPAVSVREDGLFSVHYSHMAAELWLDSTAGWLAVVDGTSRYAMVERFQYEAARTYPDKASIIFWTNGPEVKLKDGEPTMGSGGDGSPYYLEAELNSPLCQLRPGESCDFETEWFPTRAGSEFHGVSEAGIVLRPLRADLLQSGKVGLSGSFGVLFPGKLIAQFYDERGLSLGNVTLATCDPTEAVSLETEVAPPGKPARISLHLQDGSGLDLGSLEEVQVGPGEKR